MQRHYFVYIMASGRNGTLYVGVTNDILKRASEHHSSAIEGFTKKYDVHRLVFYVPFDEPRDAIAFEKQLKRWRRRWKLDLIEKHNPQWRDLLDDVRGVPRDAPPTIFPSADS